MSQAGEGSATGRGHKVLVALPVTTSQARAMEAALPGASFDFALVDDDVTRYATTPAGLLDAARVDTADIIIGNPSPRLLHASSDLVWLQLGSAGADAYVRDGVLAPNTLLTCSVGAYGQAVAEHSFAMLLAIMKRLPAYRDDQRAHVWSEEGTVSTLDGARVLVIGAGDLGMHFARLCHGVGATCTAMRRQVPAWPSPSYTSAFDHTCTMAELRYELPKADVVACFLPSSPQTRGLADATFFAHMKRGAFFVNAGRGDLVDQPALCAALSGGQVAAAALDVVTPEPLPQDSPLWDQDHLLITPHVGGFWHLPVTLRNVVEIATDNLRRYAASEELRNVVAH